MYLSVIIFINFLQFHLENDRILSLFIPVSRGGVVCTDFCVVSQHNDSFCLAYLNEQDPCMTEPEECSCYAWVFFIAENT